MKKLYLLTAIITIIMSIAAAAACAPGEAGAASAGCFTYETHYFSECDKDEKSHPYDSYAARDEEGFIAITGCDKEKLPADLVIPERIDDLPVAVIGNGAFRNCETLKSVVMPDTVAYIDRYAFSGCTAIESIYFSQSLREISYMAFYDCKSLGYIELPSSLRIIGEMAFYNCIDIKVYLNNLYQISPAAFGHKFYTLQQTETSNCFMITENIINILSDRFPNSADYIHPLADLGYKPETAFQGTVYANFESFPPDYRWGMAPEWDRYINGGYGCFTILGAEFRYDGERPYVYSVPCKRFPQKYTETSISSLPSIHHEYNYYAQPPFRSGYTFLGWALTENAEKPSFVNPYSLRNYISGPIGSDDIVYFTFHCTDINTGEVTELSPGTVLYSVWSKNA